MLEPRSHSEHSEESTDNTGMYSTHMEAYLTVEGVAQRSMDKVISNVMVYITE